MGIVFLWNWVHDGWSAPGATTDSFGNPMWLYPSQTADLPLPGVSTVVAGITAFSAAYMAYVGFIEYNALGGPVTIGNNNQFLVPQGQPLFMPSLSPFIAADDITSALVAFGLIPAGVRITDQPAGMSSPTSGLSVIVLGYD
jgi:hypothetical protein